MFFTTMILLRLTTDGHKTSRNSRATCYYCIIYVMYFFWINKDETGWDVTSEESASAYQNGPIVCQAWHNSGAILTVQRRRVQYRDRGICKSPLATRCMRAMSNITRQPFTRSHLADECTYCCAEQVKDSDPWPSDPSELWPITHCLWPWPISVTIA